MTAAQLNAFLMRNMDADVNLNVANEVSGVLPALRDVMVLFVSLTLEVATLGSASPGDLHALTTACRSSTRQGSTSRPPRSPAHLSPKRTHLYPRQNPFAFTRVYLRGA